MKKTLIYLTAAVLSLNTIGAASAFATEKSPIEKVAELCGNGCKKMVKCGKGCKTVVKCGKGCKR
jgi:hypothetical protein